MKVVYCKLKDCCLKIGSGATPKGGKSVYTDNGVSLIRSQNVYNLNFAYKGLAHINDDAAEKLRGVTVKEKDVLLNITGDSVARTCVVPNDVLPARVNQHVAIIRPKQSLNSLYLNYYLASPAMQGYLLNIASTGASRNAITKAAIEKLVVPVPEIGCQQQIANVLSAYDNLIENNNKRIKILEQMAENLYKEWFVRFRFPGHESTPLENGIPKAWMIKRVDELAKIKAGGDRPDICEDEITDNCKVPVYSNGIENEGLYGFTDVAEINKASVTISARGTIGYVCLRRIPFVPIVRLLSVTPNTSEISVYYLYYMLKNDAVIGNGTSQQQITVPMLGRKKILVPENSLIDSFTAKAENIWNEIDLLKKATANLIKQRDLLLPRLMSGKQEISNGRNNERYSK